MTRKELFAIIDKLQEEHGRQFKDWYDQANYPDVEHYCEIGYLLTRFWKDPALKDR